MDYVTNLSVCRSKQRSLTLQSSILLISSDADPAYVNHLQTELAVMVVHAVNLRAGLRALREQSFSLVILSASGFGDPTSVDLISSTAGLVPVFETDLKSHSPSSLLHQVRSILSRIEAEQLCARNAAIAHLRGELRESLTGLLLESQLALREVDASKHPRLVSVVQLAKGLSTRLKLVQDSQR